MFLPAACCRRKPREGKCFTMRVQLQRCRLASLLAAMLLLVPCAGVTAADAASETGGGQAAPARQTAAAPSSENRRGVSLAGRRERPQARPLHRLSGVRFRVAYSSSGVPCFVPDTGAFGRPPGAPYCGGPRGDGPYCDGPYGDGPYCGGPYGPYQDGRSFGGPYGVRGAMAPALTPSQAYAQSHADSLRPRPHTWAQAYPPAGSLAPHFALPWRPGGPHHFGRGPSGHGYSHGHGPSMHGHGGPGPHGPHRR